MSPGSPVQGLDMLTISARSPDPLTAERIANAAPLALESFIRQTGTMRDQITLIQRANLPTASVLAEFEAQLGACSPARTHLQLGARIGNRPDRRSCRGRRRVREAHRGSGHRIDPGAEVHGQPCLPPPLGGGNRGKRANAAARRWEGPQWLELALAPAKGLVDPGSPSSEPFRALRLALQLPAVEHQSNVLLSDERRARRGQVDARRQLRPRLGDRIQERPLDRCGPAAASPARTLRHGTFPGARRSRSIQRPSEGVHAPDSELRDDRPPDGRLVDPPVWAT